MTPEIAKFAAQFLARVQLTGAEVPAYVQVMQALEKLAPQPREPVPELDLAAMNADPRN